MYCRVLEDYTLTLSSWFGPSYRTIRSTRPSAFRVLYPATTFFLRIRFLPVMPSLPVSSQLSILFSIFRIFRQHTTTCLLLISRRLGRRLKENEKVAVSLRVECFNYYYFTVYTITNCTNETVAQEQQWLF